MADAFVPQLLASHNQSRSASLWFFFRLMKFNQYYCASYSAFCKWSQGVVFSHYIRDFRETCEGE